MNNERFCVSTGLQLPWKTRCTRTTDQQRQVSSKNEHVHTHREAPVPPPLPRGTCARSGAENTRDTAARPPRTRGADRGRRGREELCTSGTRAGQTPAECDRPWPWEETEALDSECPREHGHSSGTRLSGSGSKLREPGGHEHTVKTHRETACVPQACASHDRDGSARDAHKHSCRAARCRSSH